MGNLLTFLIMLFCTSCRPALAARPYGECRHAHSSSPITFNINAFMGLVLLSLQYRLPVAEIYYVCSLDANLPNYNIFPRCSDCVCVCSGRVELPISASGIYRKHERAKFLLCCLDKIPGIGKFMSSIRCCDGFKWYSRADERKKLKSIFFG